MKIAAMLFFVCGLSMAEACLEIPKTINLQNSPFPFRSFSLTSGSFEYVTPDGMINTLRCQKQGASYEWGVATSMNGTVTEYGYSDLRSAGALIADGNEKTNPTPLVLGDSATGATAQFTKQTGQSAIELNCNVVGNIMTMNVGIRDNNGRSIATIRAAKMVGTRSIGLDQPQASSPVVDFSSSRQQAVDFAGCGADLPPASSAPARSTTTPIGQ
jgi:hypothetical protein